MNLTALELAQRRPKSNWQRHAAGKAGASHFLSSLLRVNGVEEGDE
jgi:hypothetical protein